MKFIKNILKIIVFIILVLIGAITYSRYIEPNLLTVSKYRVDNIDKINESKIVFFTDTHIGKFYPENNIEKIVKKINSQNPDLVIFGGDFFDNYARDRSSLDLEYLKTELGKIEAKYGKYAVFGNHDYGGGAVRIYEEFMSSSGFTVLKNQSEYIEELKLNIIGYDDYLLGKTDKSLYKINTGKFNIVVTHEPDVVQLIESSDENFVLAGHSHGGQVSLPYVTEKVLPIGANDFVKGYYPKEEVNIEENIEMYVSHGIGMTTVPFRFLNPPQIFVMDIKPR